MKITIDTKTDSHEEIKRAIQLLSYLIKKDNFNRDRIVSNSTNLDIGESLNNASNESNAFASMFGGNTEKKEEKFTKTIPDTPPNSIPDTPPNFNSFLNLVNDNEKKENNDEDDPPKITLF